MSGLHDALTELVDEWAKWSSPLQPPLRPELAASKIRALLAEHPPADLPVATGDAGTEGEWPERRPWRPEDGDTRCQKCGHEYRPWFTDNTLWNEVMGGSAHEGDPGGYLCPRCFTVRAERTFPGLIWRVIPQWNGRAEPMDWPIADAVFASSAAESSPEDAGGLFIDHDGGHSGSVSLNVWLPGGGSARVAEKCELLDETWEAVVVAVEGGTDV